MNDIKDTEARVNVTFSGANGDLPDPVMFQATDGDIRAWVTEAVRTGGVPGIPAAPNADFSDFVIDRFTATEARPWNLLAVRPKTPFGFATCDHCTECFLKRVGRSCCGCGSKR